MKVLVACEESQTITKAFRLLGVEAYSCDIISASGGKPEWHIQTDALQEAYSNKYTLMIAHPPCTYLSKAGARWMYPNAGEISVSRYNKAMLAKNFFLKLLNAPIQYICVENPTPLKIIQLPPFSQAIQPFQFGHPFSKRTLLWLKNLPHLKYTNQLTKYTPFLPSNTGGKKRGQNSNRGVAKNAKESSKTFQGVADAMAKQWSMFIQ